jgi:hypothetical protein
MKTEKLMSNKLIQHIFAGINVLRKRGESEEERLLRMKSEYRALSGRNKQTITLRLRKALANNNHTPS